MPNYYQFTKPGAEEPTPLVAVEKEFLTELNLMDEIHPKRFHPLFDAVQWHVAMFADDPEKLERMFDRIREAEASHHTFEVHEGVEDGEDVWCKHCNCTRSEGKHGNFTPVPDAWYRVVKEFVLGPRYHASAWYAPR